MTAYDLHGPTLWSRLLQPIDIASPAVYRVMFATIALWELWRYADRSWTGRYDIDPPYDFVYLGFSWVRPRPGDGMYYHVAVLAIA